MKLEMRQKRQNKKHDSGTLVYIVRQYHLHGRTQRSIAKELGIPFQTVFFIVHGEGTPAYKEAFDQVVREFSNDNGAKP